MICNIGDTLSFLSGGILKSAVHRVLYVSPSMFIPSGFAEISLGHRPPPGEQAGHERWSLVYFSRPTDDVYLEPLSEKSAVIAGALKRLGEEEKVYAVGMTAAQWLVKRQLQYRPDSKA